MGKPAYVPPQSHERLLYTGPLYTEVAITCNGPIERCLSTEEVLCSKPPIHSLLHTGHAPFTYAAIGCIEASYQIPQRVLQYFEDIHTTYLGRQVATHVTQGRTLSHLRLSLLQPACGHVLSRLTHRHEGRGGVRGACMCTDGAR